MKRNLITFFIVFFVGSLLLAQGPNKAFSKFRKIKNKEFTCTENCSEIVIIFEKGTFVNPIIKGGIGIDDKYALATAYGTYATIKIPAGKHSIIIAQGTEANSNEKMFMDESNLPEELDKNEFSSFCTKFSKFEDYCIAVSKLAENLVTNLKKDYLQKILADRILYIQYELDLKANETYYFKALKTKASFECGPIFSQTSKADFEKIKEGKTLKKEEDPLIYIHPKFK
jgi:hypothetical protein